MAIGMKNDMKKGLSVIFTQCKKLNLCGKNAC
jgi:hypothetical protein